MFPSNLLLSYWRQGKLLIKLNWSTVCIAVSRQKCKQQSQAVILVSSNWWILISEINLKINLTHNILAVTCSQFSLKSYGQGTVIWELPTISFQVVLCTFTLFFSGNLSQNCCIHICVTLGVTSWFFSLYDIECLILHSALIFFLFFPLLHSMT